MGVGDHLEVHGADHMDDHQVASRLAASAGELLLALRHRLQGEGISNSDLASEGDRQSHEFIAASLAACRPGEAILSEEGAENASRLDAARIWVVDPLDGTREFAEGRADWAVHVALVIDHRPAAGAVALPGEGLVLDTSHPPPLPPAKDGPLRILVSRTRPPALAEHLAKQSGGELVAMGSAGAKAMAVVRGKADVYVHAGGQYEWDSAAPVAVALAAGLHASRIDGSELLYNQPSVYLPDLLVCRKQLAADLLELMATWDSPND